MARRQKAESPLGKIRLRCKESSGVPFSGQVTTMESCWWNWRKMWFLGRVSGRVSSHRSQVVLPRKGWLQVSNATGNARRYGLQICCVELIHDLKEEALSESEASCQLNCLMLTGKRDICCREKILFVNILFPCLSNSGLIVACLRSCWRKLYLLGHPPLY